MAAKSEDRAEEYRALAGKLRIVASNCHEAPVKIELLWMAQSYEKLALKIEQGELDAIVVEGVRFLEIPESIAKSRN